MSFGFFLYKTSLPQSHSFLIYSCFGLLLLSMGAIKQAIAMSIGIWFIYDFVKNERVINIWLLFLAVLIHPFVILYSVVFFITDNVWDRKKKFIFISFLVLGPFISYATSTILSFLSIIDVNYSEEYIENSRGGSIIRLAVYAMPVFISYFYRNLINSKNDKFVIVVFNFSIMSFLFFYLGVFQAANMFGRLSAYFDILSICSVVWLVTNIPMSKVTRLATILSMYCLYSLFLFYELEIKRGFDYKSHLHFILG